MSVDICHPDHTARVEEWRTCRDLAAGEAAVKARGGVYLPPLEGQKGEQDPAYKAYVTRAMLYPAFDRTVTGLSGLVLRRPGTFRVPAAVTPLLDDLTLERDGGLQGVLVRVLREVIGVGRLGALIDWNDALSRPYWTLYDTEQIVNWREARVDGVWTPTLVVLSERVAAETQADPYKTEMVQQWRELYLDAAGVFQVRRWRKVGDEGLVIVDERTPKRRGEALRAIPFVALGPRGGGLAPTKPPLLDLAWVNLSHYRSSADLEHGRHFTALPTPYVIGWVGEGALKIGAGEAWLIPNEQAKVGMLEFSGQGLGALERALEQKEKLMAVIGARMLEQQPRAAETAQAVRMRQGGDHTTLQTITASLSAGLTLGLQWSAWWLGAGAIGSTQIEARLNTDFVDTALTPQEVAALMQLWQARGISYETLYYNLQRGEVARPGVELIEELDAIAAEDALAEVEAPEVTTDDAMLPPPSDENEDGEENRDAA